MTLRFAAGALACLALGSSHASPGTRQAVWLNATQRAGWAPGYAFTATEVRDTLWIFGHHDGNWFSADGRQWTRDSARSELRSGYNVFVVMNGAIFAIGGAEQQNRPSRRSVWRSLDGRSWELLTDHPGWSARVFHTAVVHDGRIWLLGGYDGANYTSDVWSSSDGVNWQLATSSAPWKARCMHSSAAFDGKLWVLGGRRDIESWWETDFNDVWSTVDGVRWQRATGGAPWSKRYGASTLPWRGRLWLMGGTRFQRNNEVWSSADGSTWSFEGRAAWSPRFGLASAVFRDRVWVLGGKEGGGRFRNDVWFLDVRAR
jgi:hypothetical protein